MISIKIFITALAVLTVTCMVMVTHKDYFLRSSTPEYITAIPVLLCYGSIGAMAASLIVWVWSL